MRVVHMNPVEAVQAHLDLEASQSVAMHFGTFQLTAEGIDEPARDLTDALLARGLALSCFRTLAFGDSFRLEPRA
jgi:L-ascorbate metabolism protein UlaG (beta-lactamase superfamily)